MLQILFNFMLKKPYLKVENLQQIFGLKKTFDRFGQFGPPLFHFWPKLLSPNTALEILLKTILGIPRILEFINNPHVEEEEEVTEQVDGIDRDPAEKESNAYAPQWFVI